MSDSIVSIIRRMRCSLVEAKLLDEMAPTDLLVVEGEWAAERSVVMQELLQKGVPRQTGRRASIGIGARRPRN